MGASEGARFKGLFPAAPYTKEIDAKLNNSVVSWSRDEDDPRNKFRADVYLYSDCAFQDPDSVPRQPSLSFSEIDNIRIAVEKGLSDVQVKSESNGWIVSTPGAIGTFWMPQPDASEEHLRSQNTFHSTDVSVEFRSNDPLEIRVTGFVINSESEADNYQKSPNEISMQIGAVERQLSFKPSDRRLTGRALLCQPIPKIDDISVLMSLTLVIRVFPANQDRVLFNRFEHFVSLRGDWMDVDLVDRDLTAFDNVSLGRAGFMGISSGLRELSVQGRPVLDPTDSSVLWVRGKIDVRSEDASTLFLEGTAEMMWVDERRLNPTRWELLSSDERMWALGGLGTFVLSVLAWLVPFVRRHWLGAVAENRAA